MDRSRPFRSVDEIRAKGERGTNDLRVVSQGRVEDVRIFDRGISSKQCSRNIGMAEDGLAEDALGVGRQLLLPRLELLRADGGRSAEA
jgi:hypothetical protein